jgi:DUF1009 family protein
LGIIAGGGQFPLLCAKEAVRRGVQVAVVAHRRETDPSIESFATYIKWVHLGQLGKIISFFRKKGVNRTLLAGTITKTRIFFDVRPDLRALSLWNSMKGHLDDGILRGVADELAKEGIEVVPSTILMEDLVTPEGVLTRRRPSKDEKRDMEFGIEIARKIGQLDIGQCIVVKDRAVLAVEAIEGTDETIRRGAGLGGGEGACVIKICKPNQDLRFDLPSIGLGTIETMIEAGASCLAVEAGRSLFFDRHRAIELADRHSIAIVGIGLDRS